MKNSEQKRALAVAVKAARAAGRLMRQNLRATKTVNEATRHDIKLELDVRCQKLIERKLLAAFPAIGFLGEEGESQTDTADLRWVVDPIDGTVNFAYGIPHACVSIALQVRSPESKARNTQHATRLTGYDTIVGVVYDPFADELWTAIRGGPAHLNGKIIRVSNRRELRDAIVSTGFAKSAANLKRALPYFLWLVRRVRKVRMMGAAALALTYVATGRFDAYVERGVNLWDIAAGGLIIESAGGTFWREPSAGGGRFRMVASNGLIDKKLPRPK
ncbi:MAG TPA: inositol monophosphatase family protein [Verrucomicrobiota bacterium]|nr:inositol monophosphatase family protein [Verrucomicrobiota bacterium]